MITQKYLENSIDLYNILYLYIYNELVQYTILKMYQKHHFE